LFLPLFLFLLLLLFLLLFNYFFYIFHTVLILFNCLGWIVPKFRRWHLISLLLTAFSWFVLGIWYGWGYCVCTDWHYMVLRELGQTGMSPSYIHFLILKLTGLDFPEQTVDIATVVVFAASLVVSVWVNWRMRRD
jgi:hypothetical protein